MASIQELHYDFKIKANRVDSLANQDYNPAQIDWLLNEAQLIFIKQRFTPSNNKRAGFETSKKRVEDLSTLLIKYPLQPEITPLDIGSGIYELRLNGLVHKYLLFASAEGKIDLGNDCLKWIPLRFFQHDDYKNALRDPYNNASEEFLPFNYGLSSDSSATTTYSSIYIYSSYPVQSLKIEYLRYPQKVSLGTYVYIDGTTYAPATLDVPEQAHQEVVDIAVQLAAIASTNPDYLQLSSQKILIQE